MDKKLQQFLDSRVLEKYVVGGATQDEINQVELYLEQYPEVQEEYEILQTQLEITARSESIDAPEHVLDRIMNELDENPAVSLSTRKRFPFWYSAAASVIALLFAGTTYFFYNYNKALLNENDTIAEEIFDLRSDIENNNDKLDAVMRELLRLNNPETQKYILRGNDRAKDLKTVAYINPIDKSSLIDVVSLPELSDEECYQMWAQVNDKMINLGILDKADRKLRSVPYIENALSLSITIEPKGGNDMASLDKEVAEIPLNSNN